MKLLNSVGEAHKQQLSMLLNSFFNSSTEAEVEAFGNAITAKFEHLQDW